MSRLLQHWQHQRRPRSGIALLVACWLNLVLLPCAMAVEAPDEGHDCCPPKIEWQQVDCCEIDSHTAEKRSSKFEFDTDLAPTVSSIPRPVALDRYGGPPGVPPPLVYTSRPRHKLFCVYLD